MGIDNPTRNGSHHEQVGPNGIGWISVKIPFAHIDSLPTVYEMARVARKLMDKLTETRQISPSTSS